MNHGLFWKMGEQIGWIREDFMEQLYFSSTNLTFGQFGQFSPKWLSTSGIQTKTCYPHSIWAINQVNGCSEWCVSCPGEQETSPEIHDVLTSLPSSMSIRDINHRAYCHVSKFCMTWRYPFQMWVIHCFFKEGRSLTGAAPSFTCLPGPIFL